jgi:hypothetical protein
MTYSRDGGGTCNPFNAIAREEEVSDDKNTLLDHCDHSNRCASTPSNVRCVGVARGRFFSVPIADQLPRIPTDAVLDAGLIGGSAPAHWLGWAGRCGIVRGGVYLLYAHDLVCVRRIHSRL